MRPANRAVTTVVVNPAAGRGRAARLLPRVTAALSERIPHSEVLVVRTTSFADAQRCCREAVRTARTGTPDGLDDALVVMGGDGMMHLGLNAAAGTGVRLGLIAAGRGNDFCRGIGVPSEIGSAIETVVAGHTRSIDLMEVSGALADGSEQRWVGSILSTGFDGRVNYHTNRLRWNLGALSYAWSALAELAKFEPLRYRLRIDGQERDQTAMFVAVGNAGYFGGGMHGCPRADVTDGLLDITVIHPVSRATLLRLLPTMYTGGFVKDPAVELLQAREVEVDGVGLYGMADGEEIGPVPLRARVAPAMLQVFHPGP